MKLKVFLGMLIAVMVLAACGAEGVEEDAGDDEETDAVAAASFADDPEGLHAAAGEDGTWIIIPENDMTLDEDLVVTGTFYDGDDEDEGVYRKFAAYTQDDDRNIVDQWTITVPTLVVESENLNFQGGTVDGDVYVDADDFLLHETATVTGDVVFANEDFEASADLDGTVEGDVSVE
ncbi:hypothetical protein SAMN05421734_11125 [Pelagirhabdus alkalitolerans]|uniref:Polymer-forming protein n=1 Tax=Pelagirhabdus alkalitolerans TaxID=1612202 RepID=A0A1G6MI69_9BACI|nr:hypothetical protein [Pelagirhabdus alkalitolerans]SDC55151.1 hypothetical protein SAMN05421734_11125 [Pelagirhabdus alkalitolerans]